MKIILILPFLLLFSLVSLSGQQTVSTNKQKLTNTETVTTSSNTNKLQNLTADVLAALKSKPDKYGIPNELYKYDFTLSQYRDDVQMSENSTTTSGVIGGTLVVGGVILAVAVPDFVWAPYGQVTGIPYGYFVTAVGAGVLIYAICTYPQITINEQILDNSYKEKYGQDVNKSSVTIGFSGDNLMVCLNYDF